MHTVDCSLCFFSDSFFLTSSWQNRVDPILTVWECIEIFLFIVLNFGPLSIVRNLHQSKNYRVLSLGFSKLKGSLTYCIGFVFHSLSVFMIVVHKKCRRNYPNPFFSFFLTVLIYYCSKQ